MCCSFFSTRKNNRKIKSTENANDELKNVTGLMDSDEQIRELYFHISNEINERESNSFSAPWTALAFVAAMVATFAVEPDSIIAKTDQIKMLILSVFPIVSIVALYQFTSQARIITILQGQANAIESSFMLYTFHYHKMHGGFFNSSKFKTIRLSTWLIFPYLVAANTVVFYLIFKFCSHYSDFILSGFLLITVLIGFIVMARDNLSNNALREKIAKMYEENYKNNCLSQKPNEQD